MSIGEDDSEPEEWRAFEMYPEDIRILKVSFLNSEIIHVPQTENLRADSLARSVKKQPSFVVHMDANYQFGSGFV